MEINEKAKELVDDLNLRIYDCTKYISNAELFYRENQKHLDLCFNYVRNSCKKLDNCPYKHDDIL